MIFTRSSITFGAAVLGFFFIQEGLQAGSHLWKINEIFSSADGRVQFIELHECCGANSEIYLRGIEFTSQSTGSVFTFPSQIAGPTGYRYLLLATQAFADLPGAPEPDYIIPESFIGLKGDTLWYSEARNYDRFVYGPGDLPTDGIRSIQVANYVTDRFTTGDNSPTNYAGGTGSVDTSGAPFKRGDCNVDGQNDMSDAISLLHALFLAPRPFSCEDTCDANDDGDIDISDAVSMLVTLFIDPRPLPPPQDCAGDPTPDGLGCDSFAACS